VEPQLHSPHGTQLDSEAYGSTDVRQALGILQCKWSGIQDLIV